MKEKETLYTVGVGDALSAKLANEFDGIDAILASGFSVSAHLLGLPDVELYTKSDNLHAVSQMCYVSDKPIIADCDTGYGNAVTVIETIQDFERAGVAGIILEDQISPKTCPICVTENNTLISAEEAAGKIRAAAENRLFKDTVIIARTDVTDRESLVKRCKMYIEAGADLIQPISKAFDNIEDYAAFAKEIDFPLSMILVGWLDKLTNEEITYAKPKIAHFALAGINAAYPAIRNTFEYLSENKTSVGQTVEKANHAELVEFLGMPQITKWEKEYIPVK